MIEGANLVPGTAEPVCDGVLVHTRTAAAGNLTLQQLIAKIQHSNIIQIMRKAWANGDSLFPDSLQG